MEQHSAGKIDQPQTVLVGTNIAPSQITVSPLFTADEIAKLASDHGVEREVAELVSTMLRIIECRRVNLKP